MTQTFSLLGFVAHLHAVERDMEALGPAIVKRACEMVAAEAKRVIGVGYETWPQLAPSTLARKFYNTPLLETGELRNSIEWTARGLHGEVGSNNDKAVWHELGTSRIPPRPFLSGAAAAMGPRIEKMAGRAVFCCGGWPRFTFRGNARTAAPSSPCWACRKGGSGYDPRWSRRRQ
jgi:hypothetical protein